MRHPHPAESRTRPGIVRALTLFLSFSLPLTRVCVDAEFGAVVHTTVCMRQREGLLFINVISFWPHPHVVCVCDTRWWDECRFHHACVCVWDDARNMRNLMSSTAAAEWNM